MKNNIRERLIDLLEQADGQVNNDIPSLEMIADYLIANGVIVPPCKMGDKIYMLVTRKTTRFDFPNGKMKKVISHHTFIKETTLTKSNFFNVIESFGKTVFLTKEQAEQKLKELNGMRSENDL